VSQRDLTDYGDDELQQFKSRLQAQRITGRGDGPSYQRTYRKAMLRKIDAELKRRGLPVADGRVYGVAAQIAVDKAAA